VKELQLEMVVELVGILVPASVGRKVVLVVVLELDPVLDLVLGWVMELAVVQLEQQVWVAPVQWEELQLVQVSALVGLLVQREPVEQLVAL
jgi:hypothetical protein